VKTSRNTVILDAYNANPSSMQAAIRNFSEQQHSNKLVILGDMFELGDYTPGEHRAVLEQLSKTALNAILVGPHFCKAKDAGKPGYLFFEDAAACSGHLEQNPPLSCFILIKGSRGMKLESLVDQL
jgi:UDP-N-acetylmuramoyl-tripeptide--D-alanyl-D-alanine ligase